MTTLVALASKHALVMGTDSLVTVTRRLVDPLDLLECFETKDDFKLKVDDQGKPLLDSFRTLMEHAQAVPYNQLSSVSKLFDLSPLPMGVMFTGTTSIGTRTIGKLISQFREADPVYDADAKPSNYTVRSVGGRLLQSLRQSLSGIPSAVMVLRILHPILASTLCMNPSNSPSRRAIRSRRSAMSRRSFRLLLKSRPPIVTPTARIAINSALIGFSTASHPQV